MNDYVVIIFVNDEPSKPPIITGVIGPMTEDLALKFALDRVDLPEKIQEVHYLVTPIMSLTEFEEGLEASV